ncbi:MAG TPA: hypothetical protein PLB81_01335 [Deltaproteobacteria bacterium]|nr:hypothetical protein [Deltaproteobacteria bacterium]
MSQSWTDDCYDSTHVGQTDLQNMENNFACLKSSFSGASAPSNPVAGMFWLDTTNHILKMRNEANSAWISLYDMANSRAVDAAKASGISITAGTGLIGGGALSASRSIAIADGGVGATQIADGCITAAKLAPYSAGDYVIAASYQGRSTSSTSYVKLKEIQLDRAGTLRIYFELLGVQSTARIYRNGSAVGTERSGPGAFTEDISGWSAGDLVQLYAKTSNSSYPTTVSNFRIKASHLPMACVDLLP